MLVRSRQVKGKGRGHTLGFPTINLSVSKDLILDDGIYAAWVVIGNKTYKGALHYGSVPTFNEKEVTMEVYLLDVTDDTVPETDNVEIEIDVVEKLRDIRKFIDSDELVVAMTRDVEKVLMILK